MAIELHFTKSAIERIRPPLDDVRSWYKDNTLSSLHLSAYASGKKVFYVYKRIENRPKHIKLGSFPDLSVEAARRKAMAVLGTIAQGDDPSDRKRQLRKEITFGELFKIYMNDHAKIHNRSYKSQQSIYDCHLRSKFENTKLSDLTPDMLRNLHRRIGDNAKTTANRVVELVSAVFSKGVKWQLYRGDVPTKDIEKFKMKSRDRFLHPNEMPKFFKALDNEPNEAAKHYIYMSLFTGARKSNVLTMRWDELNLKAEQPYWRIPEAKSKSGEPMHIPLAKQALQILKYRQKNNSTESPYVFLGSGNHGHLSDPRKAWIRVLNASGISDLRIHDLRRTLGSWLAASGANSFMIGKALGHQSPKSTAVYTRLNLDPVAQSVDIATKAMVEAGKMKVAK